MNRSLQTSILNIHRIALCLFICSIGFSQNISLSGIIKNPADKPVKDAIITLRNLKNEILFEETTNRKGKFEFENVEPKFYYILIEHDLEGSKRIKLNPKKNKNNNVEFIFLLNGKDQPVDCYLYNNDPPTLLDPVLKVRNLEVKSSPRHISITWKDIKQAKLFTLFENEVKVYVGEDTRFEKDVYPGTNFCYTIKATGNYNLDGELSNPICMSAPTSSPRDIKIDVFKNDLLLTWGKVEGAVSYDLYQNDVKIGNYTDTLSNQLSLEFDKEYLYKIKALDALNNESIPSTEVKGTTHGFIAAPILSSMSKTEKITLIWNEIDGAKTYNIYRDGVNISFTDKTSFTDPMVAGKKYCYKVSCVDQYDIESDKSNEHCTKVLLSPPNGLRADADVISMHLNWDEVSGADQYKIYEKVNQDSLKYLGKTKSTQFTVRPLSFSADVCFVVASIDMDGEESDYSSSACNIVLDPPHFSIQKMTINEPSGNGKIDANEIGSMQFSIFNDGQSPAHNVIFSALPLKPDPFLVLGDPFILDTLEAGRIKYVTIKMEGKLQVNSGENQFELRVSSREKVSLDEPYTFKVETESMVPPQMIVADFAVSNEFGTHYIPKNEITTLTVRIQNVGEGSTDYVVVDIDENRTFSTPDFTGSFSMPLFKPGDYMDLQIPIKTNQANFSIGIKLTDYLNTIVDQRLDLECMKNYRSPMELTIQDLGTEEVVYYPDELGEIDVDKRIPFGRKNPNAMAIILGTEEYDDKYYPKLEYSNRDKSVMRNYFSQAFGLSDFQMLPSKPWQMDGGPTLDDLNSTFDPHQGDLRKRILTAERYSGVEEMHIFIYYRGYGEWVDGRPLLIPKDAKSERHVTKYPLEKMIANLTRLSVLENIKTITLFMDVTYVNPEKSAGLLWDYPPIPEKICILSASSNGETSQLFTDKKHSFFTYSLLKGMASGADDGDSIIELGELVEYIYKTVPNHVRSIPGSIKQNPRFSGMDLKRIVLDLR